jgi:OOP family OmpA-OmpF porin
MKALGIVLLFALPSLAQAGGYVGFGTGSFDYSEKGDHVAVLGDLNDTTTSYSIYGGYEFFKYFAVEGSIGKSGEIQGTLPIAIPGLGPRNFEVSAEYDIAAVRAVGFLPVGKKVRLLGSLGTYALSLDTTATAPSFPQVHATSDDQGLGLMLGVQFDFAHVSIRARYETYNTESNLDLSDVGLGFSVRF